MAGVQGKVAFGLSHFCVLSFSKSRALNPYTPLVGPWHPGKFCLLAVLAKRADALAAGGVGAA